MVIFGAGGDLTKRLVVPALYNLSRTQAAAGEFRPDRRRPRRGTTEELARTSCTTCSKASSATQPRSSTSTRIDEKAWKRLAGRMTYLHGDLTKPDLYGGIGERAGRGGEAQQAPHGNAIFYLAVADRFFGTVVDQLGKAGADRQREDGDGKPRFWRRVVIEKPFGHSLDFGARRSTRRFCRCSSEDQIYRIDHFLGKETVQNIMAFRFANGLFEPIWNRDRIDHVQITVAETVGVEQRGNFYEATGALRDMVPNHLFTLLSMVAMEPPVGFDADAIRDKKAESSPPCRPIEPDDAVRGQYGAGTCSASRSRPIASEPNVAPNSNVETYVAMRLEIDNWRWAGVPFFLRTGKRMSSRNTEIAIRFKQAPYRAVPGHPGRDAAAELAGAAASRRTKAFRCSSR